MKSNSQQSNLDSSVKNIISFWLFGPYLFYATCHLPNLCSHSLSPHSIKVTKNSETDNIVKASTQIRNEKQFETTIELDGTVPKISYEININKDNYIK